MNKHLYKSDGTGTNGNNDITLKVNAFVDDICKSFPEYNDAELELYIMEDIISRFCYNRIKKRVELMQNKNNNT